MIFLNKLVGNFDGNLFTQVAILISVHIYYSFLYTSYSYLHITTLDISKKKNKLDNFQKQNDC